MLVTCYFDTSYKYSNFPKLISFYIGVISRRFTVNDKLIRIIQIFILSAGQIFGVASEVR